ncbi:hypothetical protein [Aliivibrio fischeri]|uniref:hypothetical protein n=1 Tax=Aliivibrio fischeri TaxID=668 RepID=UPI0012902DE6|nr:hypothetical protein [Aliivibrio fischeri]
MNEVGYPYTFSCYLGSTSVNFESIQIKMGSNFTGIEKKELGSISEDNIEKSNLIFEQGCALVFSQCTSGKIMIMLYPYKSELHSRCEKDIMLHQQLLPEQLTDALVLRSLQKLLFYARVSSINGIARGYSFKDRLELMKLNYLNIRSRNKCINAFLKLTNEWWKVVISILSAIIVALLV